MNTLIYETDSQVTPNRDLSSKYGDHDTVFSYDENCHSLSHIKSTGITSTISGSISSPNSSRTGNISYAPAPLESAFGSVVLPKSIVNMKSEGCVESKRYQPACASEEIIYPNPSFCQYHSTNTQASCFYNLESKSEFSEIEFAYEDYYNNEVKESELDSKELTVSRLVKVVGHCKDIKPEDNAEESEWFGDLKHSEEIRQYHWYGEGTIAKYLEHSELHGVVRPVKYEPEPTTYEDKEDIEQESEMYCPLATIETSTVEELPHGRYKYVNERRRGKYYDVHPYVHEPDLETCVPQEGQTFDSVLLHSNFPHELMIIVTAPALESVIPREDLPSYVQSYRIIKYNYLRRYVTDECFESEIYCLTKRYKVEEQDLNEQHYEEPTDQINVESHFYVPDGTKLDSGLLENELNECGCKDISPLKEESNTYTVGKEEEEEELAVVEEVKPEEENENENNEEVVKPEIKEDEENREEEEEVPVEKKEIIKPVNDNEEEKVKEEENVIEEKPKQQEINNNNNNTDNDNKPVVKPLVDDESKLDEIVKEQNDEKPHEVVMNKEIKPMKSSRSTKSSARSTTSNNGGAISPIRRSIRRSKTHQQPPKLLQSYFQGSSEVVSLENYVNNAKDLAALKSKEIPLEEFVKENYSKVKEEAKADPNSLESKQIPLEQFVKENYNNPKPEMKEEVKEEVDPNSLKSQEIPLEQYVKENYNNKPKQEGKDPKEPEEEKGKAKPQPQEVIKTEKGASQVIPLEEYVNNYIPRQSEVVPLEEYVNVTPMKAESKVVELEEFVNKYPVKSESKVVPLEEFVNNEPPKQGVSKVIPLEEFVNKQEQEKPKKQQEEKPAMCCCSRSSKSQLIDLEDFINNYAAMYKYSVTEIAPLNCEWVSPDLRNSETYQVPNESSNISNHLPSGDTFEEGDFENDDPLKDSRLYKPELKPQYNINNPVFVKLHGREGWALGTILDIIEGSPRRYNVNYLDDNLLKFEMVKDERIQPVIQREDSYPPGQRILVKYLNNTWYPAIIMEPPETSIDSDGVDVTLEDFTLPQHSDPNGYFVLCDDNEKLAEVCHEDIAIIGVIELLDHFKKGDPVECKFNTNNVWLPGVISKRVGYDRYSVSFKNGEYEESVHGSYIRLASTVEALKKAEEEVARLEKEQQKARELERQQRKLEKQRQLELQDKIEHPSPSEPSMGNELGEQLDENYNPINNENIIDEPIRDLVEPFNQSGNSGNTHHSHHSHSHHSNSHSRSHSKSHSKSRSKSGNGHHHHHHHHHHVGEEVSQKRQERIERHRKESASTTSKSNRVEKRITEQMVKKESKQPILIPYPVDVPIIVPSPEPSPIKSNKSNKSNKSSSKSHHKKESSSSSSGKAENKHNTKLIREAGAPVLIRSPGASPVVLQAANPAVAIGQSSMLIDSPDPFLQGSTMIPQQQQQQQPMYQQQQQPAPMYQQPPMFQQPPPMMQQQQQVPMTQYPMTQYQPPMQQQQQMMAPSMMPPAQPQYPIQPYQQPQPTLPTQPGITQVRTSQLIMPRHSKRSQTIVTITETAPAPRQQQMIIPQPQQQMQPQAHMNAPMISSVMKKLKPGQTFVAQATTNSPPVITPEAVEAMINSVKPGQRIVATTTGPTPAVLSPELLSPNSPLNHMKPGVSLTIHTSGPTPVSPAQLFQQQPMQQQQQRQSPPPMMQSQFMPQPQQTYSPPPQPLYGAFMNPSPYANAFNNAQPPLGMSNSSPLITSFYQTSPPVLNSNLPGTVTFISPQRLGRLSRLSGSHGSHRSSHRSHHHRH